MSSFYDYIHVDLQVCEIIIVPFISQNYHKTAIYCFNTISNVNGPVVSVLY
jgi:hypothetical protein